MNLLPYHAFSLAGFAIGGWFVADKKAGIFRASRPRYLSRQGEDSLFRAVERALGSGDEGYLKGHMLETRDLRRHLRSTRKAFVRLYLKQTRDSFLASARVAREFAADSDAPELAFAVLRQTVRFHSLWAALRLSLTLNLAGPAWRLTETLFHANRFSVSRERAGNAYSALD
jgi:hypothetical protein